MKLSDRTKTILRRAVYYPAWFTFWFLTFAYCTFPYDRVRDRIEEEVERAMPGADLEIVRLAPSWISGVELTGVSLTLPPETEGERPSVVALPRVYARAGLFAALTGSLAVDFEAELGGGGTITGSYAESDSATRIVADLDQIVLNRIGPLRRYTQLPLGGTLDGEVDLTIAQTADDTQGNVTLTVAGLTVGDGAASIAIPGFGSGFVVQQINAGDLSFRMEVERGTGRIQQLSSTSEDLDLRGAGTMRLVRPLRMSNVDLLLRLDVKPPYRTRTRDVQALFELLDMTPAVRPYRAPDGAFQIRLAGSFGSSVRASAAGTANVP